MHRAKELYASGYDTATLYRWAERIRCWRHRPGWPRSRRNHQRDVYVYFGNDAKLRGPIDAFVLAKRLGLTRPGEATRSIPERKYLQAGR